ncbi:phage terminase Nu1 subunit (DNA packaging protein) [Methylobacterium sp. PvP062]|uniref:Phage terminase Nu1 subunit (DNA packaging protein) n=1 Tax=Methylobacterium radiotolerans TaxID=31998 RepID=A0ABV2NPY5_9HYPH|nr:MULTISPECIES: terminase small subunit [unclassified Methylobacterium]MBP2494700.1 phage terminase Nu1 subunit (DNA packaging protein) [Methylobacterium sp. PvP105]MBP2505429.1 phage terminase Nu1 subunit (DNA packaging protein) [Methylobacterium sp. PvP109]MCX7336169.1 terminase small subunit [Hyphomicrobiales bacterium]
MSGAIDGRLVNRADLAGIFGVSVNTVTSWIEKGCPYVERGSNGVEWQFDTAAVINWRIQRAVENVAVNAGDDGPKDSSKARREDADCRRAVANAIVAEINADEALKAVVSRHDAVADMATFCQVLRTGLSNMASKVAGRAATMTNASEIEVMAKAEMNRAFTAAREEIAQRWFAGRDPDDDAGGADRKPPAG